MIIEKNNNNDVETKFSKTSILYFLTEDLLFEKKKKTLTFEIPSVGLTFGLRAEIGSK